MYDLLLAGTHQIIKEVLTELGRDLELKSSEVTTKPTRPGKNERKYNLGVDASCVEIMLEEVNMSALKNSPTLRRERRVTDEKEMLASEPRFHRPIVGRLVWIDRADMRCALG